MVHLAEDGFANSKDHEVLRRLLMRGLVRRTPRIALLNETFRRFVMHRGSAEEAIAETDTRADSAGLEEISTGFAKCVEDRERLSLIGVAREVGSAEAEFGYSKVGPSEFLLLERHDEQRSSLHG